MNSDSESAWHIIGAGAMGLLWASYLHQAGIHATLILRADNPLLAKGNTQAIRLVAAGKAMTSQLPICSCNTLVDTIDNLLVCVKNFSVADALQSILPKLSPNANIVLTQNGYGHDEQALALLTKQRLWLASVTHGAYSPEPFVVQHTGLGEVFLGPSEQSSSSTPQAVNDLLTCLDLNLVWEPDMKRRLWHKLIVNVCINPLTALLDCDNGELANIVSCRHTIAVICEEARQVANAYGISFETAELLDATFDVIAMTAGNRSSMRQDLLRGQRTEIEAIAGFLVKKGQIHKVPTPAIETLYHLVASKETMVMKPAPFSRET